MSTFVFFSVVFFLLYAQASVYILWRNPNAGINYWFSLSLMLFAIWSLSYVFSGMGEIGQLVFDHKLITLTGLFVFPSFYFRISSSLIRVPKKQMTRNILFVVVLVAGLLGVYFLHRSGSDGVSVFSDIFYNTHILFIISLFLFLLNTYIFIELHVRVFRPKHMNERIIQHLKLVLVFCDQHWRIRYVNPYALNRLQRNLADVMDQHINHILPNLQVDGGQISGDQPYDMGSTECTILPVNGDSPFILHFDIVKLYDAHHDFYGMALIGHDLSQENEMHEKISHLNLIIAQLNDATGQLNEVTKQCSLELAEKNIKLSQIYLQETKAEESVAEGHMERDMLIKEIHDRSIDNMRIIDVYINEHKALCSHDVIGARLDELGSRIRSMSLIYKHLYFSLNYSLVDFKGFVQQLLGELLLQCDRSDKIRFNLDLSDHFLDIEKAIPLGLILNELLMNCCEHAAPESNGGDNDSEGHTVLIAYTKTDDEFSFTVSDSGPGLQYHRQGNEGDGGGLSLVEILVTNQLGGTMTLSSDRGTQIAIKFKDG